MKEGAKEILRQAGLGKHVDNVENGICPTCGKKVSMDEFMDELSKKEYRISGCCQACQNKIFKEE